jgi:protein O-GlcNAc transferase
LARPSWTHTIAVKKPLDVLQQKFQAALNLHRQGKLADAAKLCEEIIFYDRKHFGAHLLLGTICGENRQFERAVEFLSKAIKLNPKNAEAHFNCGIALKELKRYEQALLSYDTAISLKHNYHEAYYNRGIVHLELSRFEDALASNDRAIFLKPDFAEAYNNRGMALKELNRLDEALANCDIAIKLKPNYEVAHKNRGFVLKEVGRLDEALASYNKAIELKPDYAEAYSDRGIAFWELKRLDEALASCNKAIELKPDYAEAYNNSGMALKELKRLDEALASYNKAVELKPDYAEAYNNCGMVLIELKRHDEALASYNKAVELKPGIDFLISYRLHTKMFICDWRNLKQEIQELRLQIEKSKTASNPFILLGLVDSAPLQKKCAEIYTKDKHSNLQRGLSPTVPSRKHRITIGYFSADFHNHATAYLMAELFERHDHDRFRVVAFSLGPNSKSEMRERIKPHFDAFHDVGVMSDREIVGLARQEEIDIAIDLKGFTKDSRVNIFASRLAPVQVNYLGYPGTMAADFIDYVIADPTLIPLEYQEHYSEKVVYLPHSYQPNDRKREISQKKFTRAELGLPKDGFVYCCFNNNWKITPDVFDLWMDVLKRTPTSVLWLLEDNKHVAENLRREAQVRGVKPDRLIFARRMPMAQHLARHKCADLFLDTLPCNAHTTASDALWAGLPVLTRMGESFASRVAASLLNAIGLPELIANSAIEYERLAIDLAQYPAKLAAIKQKLSDNQLTMPLFDSQLYAKHLEAAYIAMHERYRSGLPAAHIRIDP